MRLLEATLRVLSFGSGKENERFARLLLPDIGGQSERSNSYAVKDYSQRCRCFRARS